MAKPVIGIGADLVEGEGRDRVFAYGTYCEAIRRMDAIPLIIAPQPENAAEVVAQLDGLVLAGGKDCDPALYGEELLDCISMMDARRQENDIALAKAARAASLPTLGVCLGCQVMNIAAGGSLYQDLSQQHGTSLEHASPPTARLRHDVRIEPGTRLAEIIGSKAEVNVNSSHHQAVRNVGSGLRVIAHAPDGVIEGVEDPQHPFYIGVQWHPEDMRGELASDALFQAFVRAAAAHARRRAETVNVL